MKAIAGIILAVLLSTMFVSLAHLSTDMDMSGSMSDCLFMTHEEVLCPMDLADHIEAWKAAFLAVAPTITLLFFAATALALYITVAPYLLKRRFVPILIRYTGYFRERTYTFSYRLHQELFSNGILHPKVF